MLEKIPQSNIPPQNPIRPPDEESNGQNRREPPPSDSSMTQHGHWNIFLSSICNLPIIRDLVFFCWKISMNLMKSASNFLNLQITSNPIPDYFDEDLYSRCNELLKEIFIERITLLQDEPPTEELFAQISTITLPKSFEKNNVIHAEALHSFASVIHTLLSHDSKAWLGYNPSTDGAEEGKPSADFINALQIAINDGAPLTHLYLRGNLEERNSFTPLLNQLDSLTFLSFTPTLYCPTLLQTLITSAPKLQQVTISPKENLVYEEMRTDEYWEKFSESIISHPSLQSLLSRNYGVAPPELIQSIEDSGKSIQWID